MLNPNWTKCFVLIGLVAGLSACAGRADTVSEADGNAQSPNSTPEAISPYHMPELAGWRSELVAFPLEFAPSINYNGHKDVRFAPGMFKKGASDYWSYTFLWWLDTDVAINEDQLSYDFSAYLTGLTNRVAGQDTDGQHEAIANIVKSDGQGYAGTVESFDAFVVQARINLNIQVNIITCPKQDKKAVIFALSPQDTQHPIWTDLNRVREGFVCAAP